MKRRHSLIVIILIYITASFTWFYIATHFLFAEFKATTGISFWLKESEEVLFVLFTAVFLYLLLSNYQKSKLEHLQRTREKEASLLKAYNERFTAVTNITNDVLWDWDIVSDHIWWNENYEKIFGYTPGKNPTVASTFFKYVHKDDIERIEQEVEQILSSDASKFSLQYRFTISTNEILFILDRAIIIRDKNGAAIRMIGAMQDVSFFRSSEEKYRLLFKDNALPMWVYDATTYQFLAVNKAALAHYGYTYEEFLQLKVTQIRPPEEVEKFLAGNSVNNDVIRNSGIWKHLKKNGELIYAEIFAQSVVYNNVKAIIVAINDVTAKLKTEEELKKSYSEIRKLVSHLQNIRDEERKRIAREIHDDLGQKLTAVKMNVVWLEKQLSGEQAAVASKFKQTISYIDETNYSVRAILNELRTDFLSGFSTKEAIQWLVNQFHTQTSIPVTLEMEELKETIEEPAASCLYRVLQETFTNITRHAQAQHVFVTLKKKGRLLYLQIKDDGIGFNQESPYPATSFGILGIKERVADVNGNFNLVTAPGMGTTIKIQIPVEENETV